jgi:hypothetical protein
MNAHCKVVGGFLRIELDKWALVKEVIDASLIPSEVNLTNNFSEVEYELVKNEDDLPKAEDEEDMELEIRETGRPERPAQAERGRGKN